MIPLFRPSVRRFDLESVLDCLVNDRLADERLCKQLTGRAAKQLGSSWGICLRESQRAIELCLAAAALPAAGRVALSPLASATYWDALLACNLEPLLVDVEPTTGVIDIGSVPQCAAVILDAPLGRCADPDTVAKLQANSAIRVIEDISCTFGGTVAGQPTGSTGTCAIIGLEAHHIITGGGGTIIVVHDETLREALQLRVQALPPGSQLSGMNAALAEGQLRHLKRLVARRNEIGQRYREAAEAASAQCPVIADRGLFFSFPLLVDAGVPEIVAHARRNGVACSTCFHESILATRSLSAQTLERLPNAVEFRRRTLLFPLYPSLTEREIEQVMRVLRTLP